MNKSLKTGLIIGGIVVAVLAVLTVVPRLLWGWGRSGYGYGMMGSAAFGGFGIMFLMPLLWIAFIGFIIWAVVAAVRRPGESGNSSSSSDSPVEILKRRYARGEISKEDFEARKKDLL